MRQTIVVLKYIVSFHQKGTLKIRCQKRCVCELAFAVVSPKEGSDEGSVKLRVAGAFQKGRWV